MGETVSNQDIQAAWHYHNGTKHPDGFLMDRWHSFDPFSHPLLFKTYTELEPIPISVDKSPGTVSALTAISTNAAHTTESSIPDADTLGKILYYSAGITKKISYPWGEMAFRAAACTGALYHIELYLVCGELPGLKAGVYHFDPNEMALKQLRVGDYRSILREASGDEPGIAHAPAVMVCTDVRWRNACKYQAREYRHAFWDCGTLLANTLAVSSACGIPSRVVLGFTDSAVNQLLDLDSAQEVSITMVALGHASPAATSAPEVGPLSLKTLLISDYETDFPAILEIHNASSLETSEEVAAWRARNASNKPAIKAERPGGAFTSLIELAVDEATSDPLETVIVRRGSARRFSHESISLQQLSAMLELATGPMPADFLAPYSEPLNDLYLIVNSVDGLTPGAYVFHKALRALEQLDEGEFRRHAGMLGLQQDLPADASVNIYMMSELGEILECLGNRGYRAAQLEASITAGRLYLAAYAQKLAASGLTFYDDAVTHFFSPHAEGKSVMFLMALGKRAR